MRLTPDVHCDVDDPSWKHNFDSRPEQLLEATKGCDKVVVFAIQAPFTGIRGSQEAVAEFVRQHSGPLRRLVLGRPERPRLRRAARLLRERARPPRAVYQGSGIRKRDRGSRRARSWFGVGEFHESRIPDP